MLRIAFFRIYHYLWHRLRCLRQQPDTVAYSFFIHCVKPSRRKPYSFAQVAAFRQKLYQLPESIAFTDPKTGRSQKIPLKKLARRTSSSPHFNQMLPLLAHWQQVSCALETGTSLGISALALAQAPEMQRVVSLEGSPEIARKARELLASVDSINIYDGLLRDAFPGLLMEFQPELVFLDADHRSSEVLFCLEQIALHAKKVKAVVIHDIYWSRDMYYGWRQIKKRYPQATAIDMYECGVLLWPSVTKNEQPNPVSFCWS